MFSLTTHIEILFIHSPPSERKKEQRQPPHSSSLSSPLIFLPRPLIFLLTDQSVSQRQRRYSSINCLLVKLGRKSILIHCQNLLHSIMNHNARILNPCQVNIVWDLDAWTFFFTRLQKPSNQKFIEVCFGSHPLRL